MNDEATIEAWSGKDRRDENFPVGSRLIRRDLRPHIHAYYAFARNADDIADTPTLSPAEKIARLNTMESVLLGRSGTGSPSAIRLRTSLAETGISPRHAIDLLIAFRQDATKTRYASWNELFDYCRTSAMPVGRYVLDLHGESRDTWEPSDALCASLQVLNHLQDCVRDLETLDRCYIPQDLLAAHDQTTGTLRRPAETPGLRAVFFVLLDRVDTLNHSALDLPRLVSDRRLRLETAVIVELAHHLAHRLRREDPLATRVKLHKSDVLSSLLRALRFLP